MYIHELKINIQSKHNKDKLVEEFRNLLNTVHGNGLSPYHKSDLYYITDKFLSCNIATLEKNSLDKKNISPLVADRLIKLENLCSSKLRIKTLGTTYINYSGSCKCKKYNFFTLFTHFLNEAGAVDCGTCFRPVPLYKLNLGLDLLQKIFYWEENYKSCDRLQITCTVGEKWATNQMTNHTSQLSKQGMEICSKIKKITGIKTFYYLYNYRKLKLEEDKKRLCPSCKGKWLLKKQLNGFYAFKCEKCELISSLTTNFKM